jgi:hypothetical protein
MLELSRRLTHAARMLEFAAGEDYEEIDTELAFGLCRGRIEKVIWDLDELNRPTKEGRGMCE